MLIPVCVAFLEPFVYVTFTGMDAPVLSLTVLVAVTDELNIDVARITTVTA